MFALSMAVDPGQKLHEALREKGKTHDEAWRAMGYRDGAQFARALTGERPLDMHKAVRLPWDVFAAWWSKLIAAKADEFGDELRADRKVMAKASLPSARKVGAA